jgi:excisionase family DNA binding protein
MSRYGFIKFPSPDTQAPLLVTPQQAGDMLSLGLTRVYELLRAGELTGCHVGRARRISTSSIVAFVDRQLADGNRPELHSGQPTTSKAGAQGVSA